MSKVDFADIEAAAQRIKGAVECTPFRPSRTLSAITGCQLSIKFENLQYTASFKERGALNRLMLLDELARQRGVIAVSAGNHAQGLAYHGQRLGVPVTIFMPEHTPSVKVEHTQAFGARVVLVGDTILEAEPHAFAMMDKEGLTYVPPYDDPDVIAGQGTIALEMFAADPDLDLMMVPIGGGGLIAGIATAAKHLKPSIKIIGVESETYPSMSQKIKGVEKICGGRTVAEGIAVKKPGEITAQIIRERVDDIVLVSESQIERAIGLLLSVEKTVAEGAGAVGLAALLAEPGFAKGGKVGMVLSGGNIDPRVLASVILRNMVAEGRVARLRIEIGDVPGQLAKVAQLIGQMGGNIVEVQHQRLFSDISVRAADLDITLETRNHQHLEQIIQKIEEQGFRVRELMMNAGSN